MEKKEKPPWGTMNPVHKGPRWVVVLVDNTESAKEAEPLLERYVSLYYFDAWRVYHACSAEPLFQLYDAGNIAVVSEGVDWETKEAIQREWEMGVEKHNPKVSVLDMEKGEYGEVVHLYPDDGECNDEDDREYLKYLDLMWEVIQEESFA